MAIRPSDELISAINAALGENTTDEVLSILEDLKDTLADGQENWKQKYEENDRNWRERYRARFLNVSDDVEGSPEDYTEDETMEFDDLFKEE